MVSRQRSGVVPVGSWNPRTPPEQRRVRTELPRQALVLTPGLQLRRAMRKVNDNLHGALAHTAAIGETCMVAAAVQAVHAAEHHLEASELSQARVALTTARERLAP